MSLLSGKKPTYLGHKNGRLAVCPNSPNCVSSQASGKASIKPLSYKGEATSAWQTLAKVMKEHKGATMTEGSDQYKHFECKTPLLGFVDDVEFCLDDKNKIIHVRSASRLGYSDLGKNRKRIEHIRQRFTA